MTTTPWHPRKPSPVRPGHAPPWVASVLYAAVLFAGVYYDLVGDEPQPPARTAGFVAALAALFALDAAERRLHRRTGVGLDRRAGVARGVAAGVLLARVGLFVAVTACDSAGLSRALFVLVPFTAYFAFGRRVSIALGAGCAGALLGRCALASDGWYTDAEAISDLLMFALVLVLTVSMAAVATGEQDARWRLESTVRELTDSQRRLRAYAARVAELSTAEERNRLAREIHDSIGHHLTAVAVQVEKAEAFRDLDRAESDLALAAARWSARRALDEARRSVRALRDEPEPFSLSDALTDLVRNGADGGGPHVTLDITGQETGYGEGQLTALYRAAQEALTNARRHADAAHVHLHVAYGPAAARLTVTDDGRGLPEPAVERAAPGVGLRGLRERLQPLGGALRVRSAPGDGTTLTATVPRALPIPEAAGAVDPPAPTGRSR
ncbi:sensor histidine kinase [Streptomyces sp. AN091965]|uniref:sensor histidine kinase n=1 Tax=Streptomyces sp. AN091965 TaxID=2927803 RepID=UPI001F60D47B|nr:sensor histidine kinase [Streptomyces sp. AN091965]MCI3934883.1 sensor histidine kinase [Streptomyces sp. AN091965]